MSVANDSGRDTGKDSPPCSPSSWPRSARVSSSCSRAVLRMLRINRFAMTQGKTISNPIAASLNPTYSCIDLIFSTYILELDLRTGAISRINTLVIQAASILKIHTELSRTEK